MTAPAPQPLRRIVVSVQVGSDRLAASDDPVFLGLRGPQGREFRLAPAKGKAWRRGEKQTFVLGGPGDPDTNVERPELNDPAAPPIDLLGVEGVYVRKGLDPIPNVRGHGELDDRIQMEWIEVELHGPGGGEPLRFARRGPFWLGLVCGLFIQLAPLEGAG